MHGRQQPQQRRKKKPQETGLNVQSNIDETLVCVRWPADSDTQCPFCHSIHIANEMPAFFPPFLRAPMIYSSRATWLPAMHFAI